MLNDGCYFTHAPARRPPGKAVCERWARRDEWCTAQGRYYLRGRVTYCRGMANISMLPGSTEGVVRESAKRGESLTIMRFRTKLGYFSNDTKFTQVTSIVTSAL